MQGEKPITIGAVRFHADRVEEVQDGRGFNAVSWESIRAIELQHGFLARHPIMQLVFGAIMTVACGTVVVLALAITHAGVAMEMMLAGAFVILGLWVMYDAMRRGHYLAIKTDRGFRKLAVGRLSHDEMIAIANEISWLKR